MELKQTVEIFCWMRCATACVQTMVWLPVLAIFNVGTTAEASVCMWGLYKHCKSVCTESLLRKKISSHTRNCTHNSILLLTFQADALPTELSHPLRGITRTINKVEAFRTRSQLVWPSGKVLGWSAEEPRYKSALALLSVQKLWSLDTVLWLCPSQLMKH